MLAVGNTLFLELLGGAEIQPELNEEHEDQFFDAGEGSELGHGGGDVLFFLDDGDIEDGGDEQTYKLQNIEQSEIYAGVVEYTLIETGLRENANIDVKKGYDKEKNSQIAVDPSQQYKHQQWHQ